MYPISTTENRIRSLLNSYLRRICDNVDNRCPNCDVAQHNVNHIFNCSRNITDLKLIDLWERPVEVAKRLDLIPSVLHDHTAQSNPLSLPLSPDNDDAPACPPMPGTACHSPWRNGVDVEKSPDHEQIVVGSHTLLLHIPIIIMMQMQLGFQLKTAISAGIPLKLPANCSSVRQLQKNM